MKMERDSEIKLKDGCIPTIYSIDVNSLESQNDLWKLYTEVEDDDDLFNIVDTNYEKVSLDIFDKVLSKEDERLSLLSNDYFRLSQENKFLNFIEEIFNLNEKSCYIDLGIFENNQDLIDFLIKQESKLDQMDKYILLGQIDVLRSSTSPIYLIKNVNLLKMFFKGFLRENLWSSLYFKQIPMILKTNYDLSIPLVFQNREDKTIYEKLANKNGLFFL